MGGTGKSPVPVGDSPTGRAGGLKTLRRESVLERRPIPSGGSPGGTGQWPVLPFQLFTLVLSAAPRPVWTTCPGGLNRRPARPSITPRLPHLTSAETTHN